jgi:hypothetical protein
MLEPAGRESPEMQRVPGDAGRESPEIQKRANLAAGLLTSVQPCWYQPGNPRRMLEEHLEMIQKSRGQTTFVGMAHVPQP